jgi:hypothetical protein
VLDPTNVGCAGIDRTQPVRSAVTAMPRCRPTRHRIRAHALAGATHGVESQNPASDDDLEVTTKSRLQLDIDCRGGRSRSLHKALPCAHEVGFVSPPAFLPLLYTRNYLAYMRNYLAYMRNYLAYMRNYLALNESPQRRPNHFTCG